MRKIRILHLIKSLNRGGAEMLLVEGLRFADRERFELSYAYFHPKLNALAPTLSGYGARVTCLGGMNHLGMIARAARLARYLRTEQIDLLHCHLPTAAMVGRLAGRVAGVPVVYTEHNKPERYRRPTLLLNTWTYEMQAHVIAVSESVNESIRAHIAPHVPVTVIRNGVDAPSYVRSAAAANGSAVRRRLGIPEGAVVVGNVAALIPQKRLHDWIEAARRVHVMRPAIRFLLVGDGPQHASLVELISESGLNGIVHMCGIQTDVRPYLAATDIYMMSSAFEGLPVALLEAMAMSCVPVCTAVGGIPEVISDGSNGYLTHPGRPDELADRIVELAAEPDRRASLGAAARATVSCAFRLDAMVEAVERLYMDVLQRHAKLSATHEASPVAMPV